MLKLGQNFILIIIFVVSLQSCHTLNHMAFEWRYRKDYRIAEHTPNVTPQVVPVSNNSILVSINPVNERTLSEKKIAALKAIESNSKQIDFKSLAKNKLRSHIYKVPELPTSIIDTPPPSNGGYYNSYEYNGTHYRKVPRSARLGFIFSLVGLVPIYGFLLAVAAIILGSIGLSKIIKNKERYRGIGFAATAVALGLAIVVFYGLLIYLLATNDNSLFKL